MNILRKIKINSLGMYEFTKSEKKLLNFIKDNMLNLKQVTLKDHPNYIFYFNDKKELIFELHLINNWFSVNHKIIWKVFRDKLNYNHQETNILIKDIVEQVYKLNITSRIQIFQNDVLIEQAYKQQLNEYSKEN